MWTSAPGPTTQLDLLVEEHRHLGRLHAALGDVVGVVERDRQVLARGGRAEQGGSASERASPASAATAEPPRPRRGLQRGGRFGRQLGGGAEVGHPLPVDQAQPGSAVVP